MNTLDNLSERQLLEAAVALLESKMPKGWSARLDEAERGGAPDVILRVEGPQNSRSEILVEVKQSISPKDIQFLLGSPLLRKLRVDGYRPIVLVTSYLSERSRQLLSEEDVGYIDLTGNLRISLTYPALHLEGIGADRDPRPKRRSTRGLHGARVGNLVRALVDVTPPYGVTELALAARVDPGQTTRVLTSLESEALVTRGGRGRVTDVEWEELIRRRASSLNLLAPRKTTLCISPRGSKSLLKELSTLDEDVAITASFAASRIAPVAAPALLVFYALPLVAQRLVERLGLLEVSEGADAAIVKLENSGPFFNSRIDPAMNVRVVAPSQVAIDCLSGNGRMPAEGEAVIEWMRRNEKAWRKGSLDLVSWPPLESDG